jgi:beta-galactosidase
MSWPLARLAVLTALVILASARFAAAPAFSDHTGPAFYDQDKLSLGVCYYPEQWAEDLWAGDAEEMASLGIKYVRIAEFSWSRLEPSQGDYRWAELDRALDVLHAANLSVVLGTPTATPPKWLVDLYPSILPYDIEGRPRLFGSRRHYSFSSYQYRNQTSRIVSAMADRYGAHPAVVGWQLDNEYGCHDTVLTYDPDAKVRFRAWLRSKYSNNFTVLNQEWGNVFWSMDLRSFEEVELPQLTVTEANPSWRMDFQRFSSDMVIEYNLLQASILRLKAPTHFLTTNFMGFFFQFDAFRLAQALDGATWDNYSLGFTDTSLGLGELFTVEEKVRYHRTGHPDLASFHHDLYRAVGRGQFGVMEQQPGPVNWGSNNPAPANGMVRLWTFEAFAHGASLVSYFRWRRAPFAQEQMHSAIKRRDNGKDRVYTEVQQVDREIGGLGPLLTATQGQGAGAGGQVAIAFEFEAFWAFTIEPQGAAWSYAKVVYEFYSALRARGLDVAFVALGTDDLSQYPLLVVPALPFLSSAAVTAITTFNGTVVLAPRTGSKTASFQVPECLPPSVCVNAGSAGSAACHGQMPPVDSLQHVLPIKVTRVESFRADYHEDVHTDTGTTFPFSVWKEWLEILPSPEGVDVSVLASFGVGGTPAHVLAVRGDLSVHYLSFQPSQGYLQHLVGSVLGSTTLDVLYEPLPPTLRLSRRGPLQFAFNYDGDAVKVPAFKKGAFVLGLEEVTAHGVSAWRCDCDGCCAPSSAAPSPTTPSLVPGPVVLMILGGVALGGVTLGVTMWVRARRKGEEGGEGLLQEEPH